MWIGRRIVFGLLAALSFAALSFATLSFATLSFIVPSFAAPPASADKPVVVFVPGFMSSDLYDGDRKLWLDPGSKTLPADLASLRIPHGPAAPSDGLVPRPSPGYDRFLTALSRHATVVPFAYDWRRANAKSAAALDRFLAENPTTRAAERVTLVAHSMGGLVALLLAQDSGARYPSREKVAKVVTLGTPYLGSVQSVATAFRGMGLLPHARLTGGDLQRLMNSFPSSYEMLPGYLDGPEGTSCCSERTAEGRRPLALWTWEGWSALDWDPASFEAAAVQRTLAEDAAPLRAAAERWRDELPDWLFPIAGLTVLEPGGIAGTTSVAFLAEHGSLEIPDSGECGGSLSCGYGDQVIAQFSATLGYASGEIGPVGPTCSVRLGKGPHGPYYHSDMVNDPRMQATVLSALAAPSNAADWCLGL